MAYDDRILMACIADTLRRHITGETVTACRDANALAEVVRGADAPGVPHAKHAVTQDKQSVTVVDIRGEQPEQLEVGSA